MQHRLGAPFTLTRCETDGLTRVIAGLGFSDRSRLKNDAMTGAMRENSRNRTKNAYQLWITQ